jgi:hypothetical protein
LRGVHLHERRLKLMETDQAVRGRQLSGRAGTDVLIRCELIDSVNDEPERGPPTFMFCTCYIGWGYGPESASNFDGAGDFDRGARAAAKI